MDCWELATGGSYAHMGARAGLDRAVWVSKLCVAALLAWTLAHELARFVAGADVVPELETRQQDLTFGMMKI